MYSSRYSFHILTEFEISRQIFGKYPNINFMKIRTMSAELLHANGRTDGRTDRQADRQTGGQTDRQTDRRAGRHEANSRSSQYCERA
jgi:hypothetical protein